MKSINVLPAVLFLFFLNCSDRGIDTPMSGDPGNLGKLTLSFSNPPTEIVQVVARLSREGYITRVLQLTVTNTTQSATGSFADVPVGVWHLKVEALDDSAVVRYQGETNVDVVGGQVAQVSLQLYPTSGGIQIIVTWSNTPIPINGLVAYYPFNGNANDATGNGHHASVHGAVLAPDRLGTLNRSYGFDGIDDYLEVPHAPALQPPSQISVCAWVRPAAFYHGLCQGNDIVHKGTADHEAGCYLLRYTDHSATNDCYEINDLEVHFTLGIAFADYDRWYVHGTRRVRLNEWQFVVGTYDGSTMKVYADGVLDATLQVSRPLPMNTRNLFIGKDDHPDWPYLVNGRIDEVRIYNRALTASEIWTLYNQP